MESHRLLYLLVLSTVMIWGSTFAVMKSALQELSPFLIVFVRVGGASLIFGLTLLFLGKEAKFHRKDIPIFFLLGLIGVSLFMPLQIFGALNTYASHGPVLVALSPVMTTLIFWGMGKQSLNWKIAQGLALAVGGVVLLASRAVSSSAASNVLFGDSLILVSAFFWASFSVLGIQVMTRYKPLVAVAYIHLFGFSQLLIYFLCFHWELAPVYLNQLSHASFSSWFCLAFLIFLASFYGFLVWYRAIDIIGPVKTTMFQYFGPVFGSIAAILLLGESITIYLIIGGVMIVGGVWRVNRNK